MIGDHIVLSPLPAGDLSVFLLHVKELRLRKPRIAAIRGNEIAALRFFGILHIADRAVNGRFRRAFFGGVKGDQIACGYTSSKTRMAAGEQSPITTRSRQGSGIDLRKPLDQCPHRFFHSGQFLPGFR